MRNKPLDFKIGYSIMRFIANLFHHIELRPFLLHFQSNIMQVVRDIVDDMQYEQKEREGLVSIVSYILLKYACSPTLANPPKLCERVEDR